MERALLPRKWLTVLAAMMLAGAPPFVARAEPGRAGEDKLVQFEREHALNVGDKGEDRFDLSVAPPACGETVLAYDHADIEFLRKRFADARIVRVPSKACLRCSPLVVRWYNEPTGYLKYRLRIHLRPVEGRCPG